MRCARALAILVTILLWAVPTALARNLAITLVASGLTTPTSFAFGNGITFEGDAGSPDVKYPHGGVFVLAHGGGRRLAGSPRIVTGLAWHGGALYIAGGAITPSGTSFAIERWSGWTGRMFAHRAAIWSAPAGFDGFNGLAFGPDGRIYVGVDAGLSDSNDHGPRTTRPFVYDILSLRPNGTDVRVFARGMRQPWQLAFAPHSRTPFVSVLGQDQDATNPPDYLLRVHRGDDYGFPMCNQTVASACRGYTRPYRILPPHTDPMGLAIIGRTLYMDSFLGRHHHGGEVLAMPISGGRITRVAGGFGAIVGLGQHAGVLYVGALSGQVFSLRPSP